MVIPTLQGGSLLSDCLLSLKGQTRRDFEIVIVDNSGKGVVQALNVGQEIQVIENSRNAGYGGAVNQAARLSSAPYIAVLNDDATLCPGWIESMVRTMENNPDAGMCASRVLLAGEGVLDSAGMLLCADGSSKQRGFGLPAGSYPRQEPALFPSGSAALYRRKMFDALGGFDDAFFVYCEDTDLGLRGQWAGWKCLYVPEAKVDHHYSRTAGRVSPLKAYYVERNRLFVLLKTFPANMLWRAPFATVARYFWHAVLMRQGTSAAARFRQQGNSAIQLGVIVIRAHLSLLAHGRRLWRQRREIRRSARITAKEFQQLYRRHSISPRRVAEQ
ncbi:MAG TPA: glycosyltransferase [Bryobacteraceae bacterium]|nr:glycosyltransferase [Bryobacteraceae bacterium]